MREEAEAKLINSAFIGWQMGAGGRCTFGDYLSQLGLQEAPPVRGTDEFIFRQLGMRKRKK